MRDPVIRLSLRDRDNLSAWYKLWPYSVVCISGHRHSLTGGEGPYRFLQVSEKNFTA